MAYYLHFSIRKSGFELQLTEVLTADLIFFTWWKQFKKTGGDVDGTIVGAMSGVSRQWYCSWSVKLNLTTVKPVSSFQQILLHVIDLLRHL